MKDHKKTKCLVLLLVVILLLFFIMLYFTDNKYKTPPPYGMNGVISLTESDVLRSKPLVLVSGWLLSDEQVTDQPTYIGEFSNLGRGDSSVAPHGVATYNLTLRYSGNSVEVAMNFPQIFSKYVIWLDEQVVAKGDAGARISFALTDGDHQLTVQTTSRQGYYSGMYHPPMLSNTKTMFDFVLIQCIAYGLAFFASLALSVFTLILWRSAQDKVALWFGILSCSFSMYMSYYFVRILSLPFEEFWYIVQSASLYGLCLCVVKLAAIVGGIDNKKSFAFIQRILIIFSLVMLAISVTIPAISWAVLIHGVLTDIYYIFIFCALLLLLIKSKPQPNWECRFSLLGCTVFGVGLLLNLLGSKLFEPILFFWQFEWCGLFLVIMFGAVMVAKNKRILAENKAFSDHLEELVAHRTESLVKLLQERKVFFANMAHDLKAPIFATNSFIQAIHKNDTGIDSELKHYIDQVEQKQHELSKRVHSLITINDLESIDEMEKPVSVIELLKEMYGTHHMAAEVESVHLVILPPKEDGLILAQPKKLGLLLENLILNALRATPHGGTITISAELEEGECMLTVSDTGRGIMADEIPRIFDRFYVGKENKGSGTGIGLYIVKNIVEELKGEICVSSKQGQGTVFHVDLPLIQ